MKKLYLSVWLWCWLSMGNAQTALEVQSLFSPKLHSVITQTLIKFGANRVWLVFDDDDTLTATDTSGCRSHDRRHCNYLGSVAWTNWQAQLINEHSTNPAKVASSLNQLYAESKIIFDLIAMPTTEPGLDNWVKHWQVQGAKVIVETARSPDMFDATAAQLHQDGFSFANTDPIFSFVPNDKLCTAVTTHRPALYEQGMYLVTGQDKGQMLGCLFERLQQASSPFRLPKAVIFFDDDPHNIKNMSAYFAEQLPQIHLVTVLDEHEYPTVAHFDQHAQAAATRKWRVLVAALVRNLGVSL